MSEKIIIDISAKGETTVSVDGVKGKSCADITRKLEQALGATTSDRKLPEYNEVSHERVHDHQH